MVLLPKYINLFDSSVSLLSLEEEEGIITYMLIILLKAPTELQSSAEMKKEGFEQPDLVKDDAAHGKRVRLIDIQRFLQTQIIV